MNKVANVLLSHHEVSAQDVAYRLFGLPLRGSSVSTVFVNTCTGFPQNRIRLLKSKDFLNELQDDDADVFKASIHNRYANRPKSVDFEQILAQFVTQYKVVYAKVDNGDADDSSDAELLERSGIQAKQPVFKLLNNMGRVMRRKKMHV